ncbi:hypothetical protein E0Z10_g8338 [Xylaria hypoxylon]|uniref:Uncharacterized protein n=1 Tax=Xylaria hypoxylon TaxID=37992 RepID=A0A4Z0YMT7_9PEZI|nr:hypothetical protein E0Z10_g8338 [Xylaria hypoxylon]
MAAAVASTSGHIGMWNGTKDGKEDGYVDWATGNTNVNNPKEVQIEVQDIRTLNPQPSYESDGYGLVKHESSLTAEQFLAGATPEGKGLIEDVYFKEVAELVKKVTGSQDVLPYVFRIRQNNMRPGAFSTEKLSHTALPVAHVDRDNVTGENGMRELLSDRAEELLKKGVRYCQVNVWRTIGEPIQRWPLCFVNHRSVPNWTYATHMARVFPENDPRVAIRGEKSHDSVLKHDPNYKYHYASALDVNEALVFSSFDSDITKVIPHGAFWDNSSLEDAPIRRSIEVRCWVVFE